MSRYYPDLVAALEAGGAIVGDFGENMRWHTYGGYRQRFTLGSKAALMSRPFLEYLIRVRTLAQANITLIDNCAVRRLMTTIDLTRIVGVEVEHRDREGAMEAFAAGIIVDCTGRGSRTPQWLAELGYSAPAESEVKVNVGYATQIFRRNPGDDYSKEWILITPEAPRETRFGGMFPIEGDRWIVSLGGWAGDHAPTDPAGFLEYARTMPTPDIYNMMRTSEPLTEVYPHKFNASLRRHYERLTRFPAGYLVLGDAICSFNPTYGQGMTSAAMQAAALDELLTQREGELAGIAPAFFKRAAKVVDIPWQLAVGEDFRYPQTVGPKPAGIDLLNRYVAAVHRATLVDPETGRAFAKVMNLMEPPTSLMTPGMMVRVWKANRRLRRHSQWVANAVAGAAD
jgi:2-polyprenyl-6-methoxyphenol hydroxylase-like FAD-dependent oxidoreductase